MTFDKVLEISVDGFKKVETIFKKISIETKIYWVHIRYMRISVFECT